LFHNTLDNNNKVLMARRYYFLTTLENFDAVFEPINIIIYHFIHQTVCISIILTIFAARKRKMLPEAS